MAPYEKHENAKVLPMTWKDYLDFWKGIHNLFVAAIVIFAVAFLSSDEVTVEGRFPSPLYLLRAITFFSVFTFCVSLVAAYVKYRINRKTGKTMGKTSPRG